LVAITVVLAAVLYVMVTAIIEPPEPPARIEFMKDSKAPNTWELEVTGASVSEDLINYKVVILKNGSRIHTMDPLAENDAGNYRFTDIDGGGELSIGDRFIITCEPGSLYELNIISRDTGNSRGSVEWET
jgi:hypothetical protein